MSSEYFASKEQSEAHEAHAIVFWGEKFDRPNVLIGVLPHEVDGCETCGSAFDPMRVVSFDMDDAMADALELAVAKWREHGAQEASS